MGIDKLKLCGTNTEFHGIQGYLRGESRFLELGLIGAAKECQTIDIAPGGYIQKIQITYDSAGINFFKATTDIGEILTRGQPKSFDKEYVTEFTKYEQIAGFVGYTFGDITALGAYRYMCDSAPPTPIEPTDDADISCEAMGMERDPITGVCFVIDNGSDDKNCFKKDANGNCQVEPTDPLDPDNPGRDNDKFTPEIHEVDQDDSSSLTIILVVLICVLIPLVAVLGFVVYLFRKNKINSVSTAMGRRRSSVNLKENYQRRASIIDDDKMENQGKDINIMPADGEKNPQLPASETAVMAMFTQVPSDEEIKNLLKGKTAKEKRVLLKEIEKARQQKMHLEYLLAQ